MNLQKKKRRANELPARRFAGLIRDGTQSSLNSLRETAVAALAGVCL